MRRSGAIVDQINVRQTNRIEVNVRTAGVQDTAAIMTLMGSHRRYEAEEKLNTKRSDNGFLMADLTQEQLRAVISHEPAVLIAEVGREIAGFVVATYPHSNRYEDLRGCNIRWCDEGSDERYQSHEYLYLWMIGVHDYYRGKGIASQLLAKLDQHARGQRYETIITDIMLSPVFNAASDALFRKCNYKYSGMLSIDDYYGCGSSRWKIYSHELM